MSRASRSGRRRSDHGRAVAGDADSDLDADADPQQVARAICLRQLTLGPRTRAQLARAMARRNVPDDVAKAVLERFEAVGLVDDEAFAAAWVDSRHAGRGLGRNALAHELRQRGVADPLVRAAIDKLDPSRELAAARRLVARRLATMQDLDPQACARRLGGMLARKGYPAGVAYQAIREAIAADAADGAIGQDVADGAIGEGDRAIGQDAAGAMDEETTTTPQLASDSWPWASP